MHCDLTGPQLSPGSMSPTGYPQSLPSWPKTDRYTGKSCGQEIHFQSDCVYAISGDRSLLDMNVLK